MASDDRAGEPGDVSTRTMDIVVALILVALGAVVMFDSVRVGAGWAIEGPQAGYFPFYLGLLISASSAITLLSVVFNRARGRQRFVGRAQLKLVVMFVVPSAAFVVAIKYLGVYVASALFLAGCMTWIGRYRWWQTAPLSLLVPIVLFLVFDVWFLLPLPKGPLEAWLGY